MGIGARSSTSAIAATGSALLAIERASSSRFSFLDERLHGVERVARSTTRSSIDGSYPRVTVQVGNESHRISSGGRSDLTHDREIDRMLTNLRFLLLPYPCVSL